MPEYRHPDDEGYGWRVYDALGIAASADWITPIVGAILTWRYKPCFTFQVHMGQVWRAGSVNDILKRWDAIGIRSWSLGVVFLGHYAYIPVRLAQADFAYWRLVQSGIQPENRPDRRKVRRAQRISRAQRRARHQVTSPAAASRSRIAIPAAAIEASGRHRHRRSTRQTTLHAVLHSLWSSKR